MTKLRSMLAGRPAPLWWEVLAIPALLLALAVAAQGQTNFRVLYNFKGKNDGAAPTAAPLLDRGKLYGTAAGGTSGASGEVYRLTRRADGWWTETVLHRWYPYGDTISGGLVADGRGNIYGTVTAAQGPLFELIPSTGHVGHYALPDGGSFATLLMDPSGDLFGSGWAGCCGGVFELRHVTAGWKQQIIYAFQAGSDGIGPRGTPTSDARGNIYGVTQLGGNYRLCAGSGGCGIAYELSPAAGGEWKEHILHRFAQFKTDGQYPMAGLVIDAQGNLYGTTYQGGRYQTGTIFKLAQGRDGQWREKILFDFPKNSDGGGPIAPMTFDKAGNLYGTTVYGGTQACSCGVVFKISPGSRVYTVLHHFNSSDGASPYAGVTLYGKGHLYGTTFTAGKYAYGVVYEITPPGAMGKSNPVAPNETTSGRTENRRVDVKLLVNKGIAGASGGEN
jgi:uncharacterized repeat protein (TIGR03803 family)